ncbi:MAG: hypothetical protein WBD20_06010 [Pirellulaceae bacterium]
MATSVQQSTQDFAVQSQEYIQGAVETVEKQLPSSGSIALKLEPPVEMNAGKLEILTVGDGRANVVQVTSYDAKSGPNKYPCILLHGQTTSKNASELVGQTVPCDLYFQQSNGGEILMTTAGASVQVTFGQMDKKNNILMASIGSGSLMSSDHKTISFNGGDVMAIVQGGQQ